jgi:hypothetical protein
MATVIRAAGLNRMLNRESERIPRRLQRDKRANHKKDRIPYGRRFPAACCRDIQKPRLKAMIRRCAVFANALYVRSYKAGKLGSLKENLLCLF